MPLLLKYKKELSFRFKLKAKLSENVCGTKELSFQFEINNVITLYESSGV